MVTSAPNAVSLVQRWKPMNPAPPVTKIFFPSSGCVMQLTIKLYFIVGL